MLDQLRDKTPSDIEIDPTYQAVVAHFERVSNKPAAVLDAEIRADGGDPEGIGRRGAELAAKLLALRVP